MRDDPYRDAEQKPRTELERLAAEGQRRHAKLQHLAASEANSERDYNLRVALGGHFGTPFLRSLKWSHYAAIALLVVSLGLVFAGIEAVGPLAGVSAMVSFVLVFVRVFWTPKAPRSMVDAESAWLASLPFPLTGYFEALGDTPSIYCNLEVTAHLADARPDEATVIGVVHRIDPAADTFFVKGPMIRWRTGRIDGSTGIKVNGRYIHRNHNVVKQVHDVVRDVLEPIHRDYPIARVEISRR